jgi:CRP-like cAMP-binding protein
MTISAETVRNSSLGEELTDPEAGVLGELLSLQTLSAGEFLIEEGASDDALHVLVSGRLEVIKKAGADESVELAILRDGDITGELSFLDGTRHTVGLRALSDCQVLTLSRARFENIIDENPRLVYKVMRAIARSTHRIVHRMNANFIELNNYIFKQHGRY